MNPIEDLLPFTWPASQLDEAIRAVAQKSGFPIIAPISAGKGPLPQSLVSQDVARVPTGERIKSAARELGIESQAITVPYTQVSHFLRSGGPALLRLGGDRDGNRDRNGEEPRFLALLRAKTGWWRVKVVTPDGAVRRIKPALIQSAWCQLLETPLHAEIEQLLQASNLPSERSRHVRQALLRESLQDRDLEGAWLLRLSPGTSFWTLARHARLPHYLVLSVIGQAAQYLLYLATLGLIGHATLGSRLDMGLLLAGILLWLSGFPFYFVKVWADKLLSFKVGRILKERLFYGVLHLDMQQVRQAGIGQFLAWVIESERLEEATLGGGVLVLSATVSLVTTAIALIVIGSTLIGGLLLFWLLLTALMAGLLFKRYLTVSDAYNNMTLDLLERIQGHQTRLVQEQAWHDEQDQALADYLRLADAYDGHLIRLLVLMPSGWVVVGLLGTTVTFVSQPDAFIILGTSFLALLVSFQYLESLAWGMIDLVRAMVAWRLIAPIQQAATEHSQNKSLIKRVPVKSLILDGQGLSFRYQTRQRPILNETNFEIHAGDRILLEGPSGSGKSTFASLLTTMLSPESGLLLLHGLDENIIGVRQWRKRIVAAPQFHENHVLDATFAFNLLMGRRWPPSDQDLIEAETLCRELALGHLLDRMPLGLQQIVGQQGWPLSQGERSRLYIARALLQQADLIILDESFASLDPENMEIALRCVLKRAKTLLVIAHP
ncbi:MAG: ATP-binding cassette domain-containing protein [Ardenticatenaceae bacterium]